MYALCAVDFGAGGEREIGASARLCELDFGLDVLRAEGGPEGVSSSAEVVSSFSETVFGFAASCFFGLAFSGIEIHGVETFCTTTNISAS